MKSIFLKRIKLLIVALTVLNQISTRRVKSIWMFRRSDHWWNNIVLNSVTPEQWVQNFRKLRHLETVSVKAHSK
ncbi:hypothetical protein EMCRGX_G023191 [Ephydatia muelleri]